MKRSITERSRCPVPLHSFLTLAIFPLIAGHWWEHNRNKGIVVGILSVPLALYMMVAFGEAGVHEIVHKLKEYVSFITLLAALFVISGGIYVRGSLSGTPLVNTGLLAPGAAIASFVGTTGASVLLIRPLLRANASRQRKAHIVVFFIFIVSNCGGLLTPPRGSAALPGLSLEGVSGSRGRSGCGGVNGAFSSMARSG